MIANIKRTLLLLILFFCGCETPQKVNQSTKATGKADSEKLNVSTPNSMHKSSESQKLISEDHLPTALDPAKPFQEYDRVKQQKVSFRGRDVYALFFQNPEDKPIYFIFLGNASSGSEAQSMCEKEKFANDTWKLPTYSEFKLAVNSNIKFNELPLGWFDKEKRVLYISWTMTPPNQLSTPTPSNSENTPTLSILTDVPEIEAKSREAYVEDFEKALVSLRSRIQGKTKKQLKSFYAKNPGLKQNLPIIEDAKNRLESKNFSVVCRLKPQTPQKPAAD
ncbi:MAG: hypothetical protein NT027_14400 [Proteobacteria bacterium]|nr:hypothetical protein [Pseudomonadota bacterium]